MEKLKCVNAGALWGDEGERFNLELENFGVGLDAINNTSKYLPEKGVLLLNQEMRGTSAER
jgi:hypothetical protein